MVSKVIVITAEVFGISLLFFFLTQLLSQTGIIDKFFETKEADGVYIIDLFFGLATGSALVYLVSILDKGGLLLIVSAMLAPIIAWMAMGAAMLAVGFASSIVGADKNIFLMLVTFVMASIFIAVAVWQGHNFSAKIPPVAVSIVACVTGLIVVSWMSRFQDIKMGSLICFISGLVIYISTRVYLNGKA